MRPELRCGFVAPNNSANSIHEKNLLTIRLLDKIENETDTKDDGTLFKAELPNKKLCYVVLNHNQTTPLKWFAKTFFPINQEDWFDVVTAEDLAIKDDLTLRPIDRIEWHRKLSDRVAEQLIKKSS